MMRRIPLPALLCMCMLAMSYQASCADRWSEYGEYASKLEPLDPTPIGSGHIGLVDSGKWVQLRFPVPAEEAVGYWLALGPVVAYSGKGTGYQLVLRRDAQDGPILHEGVVITDGDQWNASNRDPIDLTDKILPQDRRRGYLDIYVTGLVQDDGWTVYRHSPGRPLLAHVAIMTPQMRRQMQAARMLRDSGLSLLPMPKSVTVLRMPPFRINPRTQIVCNKGCPESLVFAAHELSDAIRERTGIELKVTQMEGDTADPGHIRIALAEDLPRRRRSEIRLPEPPESYTVRVSTDSALVAARDEAGCFYGAMTLGQMVTPGPTGPSLPACRVDDEPSFPYRIIQYDIARGQTVDVAYVKRIIRELARCKVNGILFYMEDDFRFRKYPFLGREGTFTHEKARELSQYAHRYHMQLIPQFESLGHASAVLGHEEMAGLREAGGSWVFCTSEPRTWEFLDDIYAELVEAFPYTDFIHTGGDEFEMGFGKCDRCRAFIADKGIGGLYAEHMNRLNELVKKHGKTMMFWPSHHGPTPELSNMTIQYEAMMHKDCIPTEWIYHGPSSYPTIKQYQDLGFKDVYCCPAVESYSRLWPDHRTTFRGISGFYRAGARRGSKGAYCTTWEFMHGALIENSMYGLLYAAECSWNPQSTARDEFNRRFAQVWFGLRGDDAAVSIQDALSDPFPASGKQAMWRNTRTATKLLWTMPTDVMRAWVLKEPRVAENADGLVGVAEDILTRLETLAPRVQRNELSIRAAATAFGLMRYAGGKLVALKQATTDYKAAADLAARDTAGAADKLRAIASAMHDMGLAADERAEDYNYFVLNCGAYKGDAQRLRAQAAQWEEMAAKMAQLAAEVDEGKTATLPAGAHFGLLTGTYDRVGDWTPDLMSEEGTTIRFDATKLIKANGTIQLEWEYTRGAHALGIERNRLLQDGEVVAEDAHNGWTGAGHSNNVYTLRLEGYKADAKYEIVADVASRGGTDSRGTLWLVTPGE